MNLKVKALKPKLYHVTIGTEQMIVRAKTRQGAVAHASQKLVTCELADQETLVRLTKAGVEVENDNDPGPDLFIP